MKILCGIVTFNRQQLLNRCLKSIDNQSSRPNNILVINQGDVVNIPTLNTDIKLISQKNDGSAKGWFTAIKYALDNNYDYVWLMDDDGYSDFNALKNLINNFQPHYSCLSSVVLNQEIKDELVFSMPHLNKNIFKIFGIKKLSDLKNKSKNNLYPFAHLFNGALINIKAVEKIGNINTNLKMYGEEVDYFYRLKKFGPIFTLVTSFHFHPSVKKKFIPEKIVFYFLRNSIINNNKYSNYKLVKNLLIIIITLFRVYERNGIKFVIKFIFFSKYNLFKSIYHGFKK